MLLCIAALVIAGAHGTGDWASTSERLRSLGDTYKKWGITFALTGKLESEATEGPLPGGMEISSSVESPGSMKVSFATTVGEKHALALDVAAVYKMDPEGSATDLHGAVYVEGQGLVGTFKKEEDGSISFQGGIEESIYKVGFNLGKADEGPLALGLKLGPLEIDFDPVKYAKRLQEVGPTLLKTAGAKIGGVSLEVDADAMAYALNNAPAPPSDYMRDRLAVSLRGLIANPKPTIGLNRVDGVFVDEKRKDLFLIGGSNAEEPEIPTERLEAVLRAVYQSGMHPFISIDPQSEDFKKPHMARIGGVPDDLRKCSLIASMLTADYAMKQLALGLRTISGIDSTPRLMEQYGDPIVPTRFWINPAPLTPGSIRLTVGDEGRFYEVRSSPVVLTEPLQPLAAQAHSLAEGGSEALAENSKVIQEKVASSLTTGFDKVAKEWPESGFTAARQNIEMSNIASLLALRERSDWLQGLIGEFCKPAVPNADIPESFEALDSGDIHIHGITTRVAGGMTTEVDVADPLPGHSPFMDAKVDWSLPAIDLGARAPVGCEPEALTESQQASKAFSEALHSYRVGDTWTAVDSARQASQLRPEWEDAELLYLLAMKADGQEDASTDGPYAKEIKRSLVQFPRSIGFKLLAAQWLVGLASAEVFIPQKEEDRAEALKLMNVAVLVDPKSAESFKLRAKIEHRQGDDEASLKDWDRAIQLAPGDAAGQFGKAAVLASTDKLSEAKACLDAAIQDNPMYADALMVRALIEHKSGNGASALADARRGAATAFSNWLGYDILGQMLFAGGKDEEAIQAFDLAISLAPRGPFDGLNATDEKPSYPGMTRPFDLWDNFIRRCGEDHDKSELMLSAPSDASPFDSLIPLLRGEAQLHLKHLPEAKKDLTEALQMLPGKKDEIQKLLKQCE